MVDVCVYPNGTTPPEHSLRQIFVRQELPDPFRVEIARLQLNTIDKMAALGSDLDGFKQVAKVVFATVVPAENLQAPQHHLALTFLGTVWLQCSMLAKARADQRVRMEEEPHKVPEISLPQYSDMRDRFTARHPDILLAPEQEPHKRFVEKIIRDHTVMGCLPFYELGKIRLRSEKPVQKSGLAATADKLLQIAVIDEQAAISTDEDVMNRIAAFAIALEFTGVCVYRGGDYVEGQFLGGMVAYLAEIKRHRTEFAQTTGMSPMWFTIRADKKIRQMIERLCMNFRSKFPQFGDALIEVLTQHRYLWQDARNEVQHSTGPQRQPGPAREPIADRQRSRTPTPKERAKGAPGAPSPPGQGKRALRKAKAEARADSKLGPSSPGSSGAGGGAGGSNGVGSGSSPQPHPAPGGAGRQMAPQKMWQALLKLNKTSKFKACEFWNLPCDCKFGPTCKLKHSCMECGQDHFVGVNLPEVAMGGL